MLFRSLLSGADRDAVVSLERELNAAIPSLIGLSTPPATQGEAGAKAISYRLASSKKKPLVIPCELASDGALLLTAFLALAHTASPGVLLIEEPENGLHPTRIEGVVQLLRRIARGDVGCGARQVIVTTHSPLLLNYADRKSVV